MVSSPDHNHVNQYDDCSTNTTDNLIRIFVFSTLKGRPFIHLPVVGLIVINWPFLATVSTNKPFSGGVRLVKNLVRFQCLWLEIPSTVKSRRSFPFFDCRRGNFVTSCTNLDKTSVFTVVGIQSTPAEGFHASGITTAMENLATSLLQSMSSWIGDMSNSDYMVHRFQRFERHTEHLWGLAVGGTNKWYHVRVEMIYTNPNKAIKRTREEELVHPLCFVLILDSRIFTIWT